MFCRTKEISSNQKWDIKNQRFRYIRRRSHNGPIKETSLVNGNVNKQNNNKWEKTNHVINSFTS